MNIKGEKFIEMKNIMSIYQSQLDAYCINELGKVSMKIGVNVNEEQLKKWIEQAKFIEQFNVEDIVDCATRDLVYRTQQENQALKDMWQKLEKWVVDRLKYDRELIELTENDMYYDFSIANQTTLAKMQELEKEIK